jgi:POT family proton-dependent oligopeptide transporter
LHLLDSVRFYWELLIATNLEYNPILNFDNFINVLGIILGVFACFIWTHRYLSSLIKLKYVLIILAIAIAIILLFTHLSMSISPENFYPSLFLLSIAEILLAPIVYSIVVRNTNTKYIAIVLTLAFIPVRVLQETFNKIQSHFNMPFIYVLTITLVILISYLIFIFRNESALDRTKAGT